MFRDDLELREYENLEEKKLIMNRFISSCELIQIFIVPRKLDIYVVFRS